MPRRTFDVFIDLDKLDAFDEATEIARQLRRVALHVEECIVDCENPIIVSGVRVGRAGHRTLDI